MQLYVVAGEGVETVVNEEQIVAEHQAEFLRREHPNVNVYPATLRRAVWQVTYEDQDGWGESRVVATCAAANEIANDVRANPHYKRESVNVCYVVLEVSKQGGA
jgi:phenolic acid decarboxylase